MIKKSLNIGFWRKSTLVKLAADYLATIHYSDFSLSGLAASQEISEEMLSLYFENTNGLKKSIAKHAIQEVTAYIDKKTQESGVGIDTLKGAIIAYIHYFLEHPNIYRLLFLDPNCRFSARFTQDIARLFDTTVALPLKLIVRNGILTRQRSRKIATELRFHVAGMLSYHFRFNSFDDKLTLLSYFNRWFDDMLQIPQQVKQVVAFEERLLRSIFDGDSGVLYFIHYTKLETTARTIMSEGLRYVESFHNTAEQVINDRLDIAYKHSLYKPYGSFVVVIGIAEQLVIKYTDEIKRRNVDLYVENVLSREQPAFSDDDETTYLLPPSYVKGFFNYGNGEFTANPAFNPYFDSSDFIRNLMEKER